MRNNVTCPVGLKDVYGSTTQNQTININDLEKIKKLNLHLKYDKERDEFHPSYCLYWQNRNPKFQGYSTSQPCAPVAKTGEYHNYYIEIDRGTELIRIQNSTFYDFSLVDNTTRKKAWIENGMNKDESYSSDSEFSEDEEIKKCSKLKTLQARQNMKFKSYNDFLQRKGKFSAENKFPLLDTFLIIIDNKYKLTFSGQNGTICKFHFTKLKMNFDLNSKILYLEIDGHSLDPFNIADRWNYANQLGDIILPDNNNINQPSIEEVEELAIQNDKKTQNMTSTSKNKANMPPPKSIPSTTADEVIDLTNTSFDQNQDFQKKMGEPATFGNIQYIDKDDGNLLNTIIATHYDECANNQVSFSDDNNTISLICDDFSKSKTIYLISGLDNNNAMGDHSNVVINNQVNDNGPAGDFLCTSSKKRAWLEVSREEEENNDSPRTEGPSSEKMLCLEDKYSNIKIADIDEKETLPFTNFLQNINSKNSSDFANSKAGKWRYFSGTKEKFWNDFQAMVKDIEGKTGCQSFMRIYNFIKLIEMNQTKINEEYLYRDEFRLFDDSDNIPSCSDEEITIECKICYSDDKFKGLNDPEIKNQYVQIHAHPHSDGHVPYVCVDCFENFMYSKIHDATKETELCAEDFRCPCDAEGACQELLNYETVLKFIAKGDFNQIVNEMNLVRGETREEKLENFRAEKTNEFIDNMMVKFLYTCPGKTISEEEQEKKDNQGSSKMEDEKKEDEETLEKCPQFFRSDPTTVTSEELDKCAEKVPVGIYCNLCSNDHCTKCRQNYHAPATCILIQNWSLEHRLHSKDVVNAANELASEQYVQSKTRQCPNTKCGYKIQKTEGCNQMICRKCRTHFCYLCGVKYEKSYQHPEPGCVQGKQRNWLWAKETDVSKDKDAIDKKFQDHINGDNKLKNLQNKKKRYEQFKETIDSMERKIKANSKLIKDLKKLATSEDNLAFLKSSTKLKSEYEKVWVEAALMMKRARDVWVHTHISIYFYALKGNDDKENWVFQNAQQLINTNLEVINNMGTAMEIELNQLIEIHENYLKSNEKCSDGIRVKYSYPAADIFEAHKLCKQKLIDLIQKLEDRCRAIVSMMLDLDGKFQ